MTELTDVLGTFLLLSSIHLVIAGVAGVVLSRAVGIRGPARGWVLRLLLFLPLLSALALMLPSSVRLSLPRAFISALSSRGAPGVGEAPSRPDSGNGSTEVPSIGEMGERVGGAGSLPAAALSRGRLRASWRHVFVGAWLLAVAVLGSRWLVGLWSLRRVVRAGTEATDPGVLELVRECAEEAGLGRTPRVVVSGALGIPIATGLLRPVVVLPSHLVESEAGRPLRFALLHEFAHLRRRDSWHLLAESVGVILYFFHPAMRWAVRRLRDERESLCDWRVVHATGEGARYASFLVDEIERRHVARGALALSIGATEPAISRRVDRILSEEDRTMRCRTRDLVAAALFTTALLPVLALSAATQLGPLSETKASPTVQEGVYHVSWIFDRVENVTIGPKKGQPLAPSRTVPREQWAYDEDTGTLTIGAEVDNETEVVRVAGRRRVPWTWRAHADMDVDKVRMLIGDRTAVRGVDFEVDEGQGRIRMIKAEDCTDATHYYLFYQLKAGRQPERAGGAFVWRAFADGNHPDKAAVRRFLGLPEGEPPNRERLRRSVGTNASPTADPRVYALAHIMEPDGLRLGVATRGKPGNIRWLELGEDCTYDENEGLITLLKDITIDKATEYLFASGVPRPDVFLFREPLKEGGVGVVLNDRELTEGVGFTVDYATGTVTILDEAIHETGVRYVVRAGNRVCANSAMGSVRRGVK